MILQLFQITHFQQQSKLSMPPLKPLAHIITTKKKETRTSSSSTKDPPHRKKLEIILIAIERRKINKTFIALSPLRSLSASVYIYIYNIYRRRRVACNDARNTRCGIVYGLPGTRSYIYVTLLLHRGRI